MARKRSPNGFGSIRKKIINGNVYYEGRYTDPILHKQKSVSATTEKECRQKLKEVFARITTGTYVTPHKITVQEWAERWLEGREGIRESTRLNYRKHLNNHILPQLGRVRLIDLRPVHCQEFIRGLSRKKDGAGSLSPTTIGIVAGTLRTMLDAAVRLEMIPTNPAARLEKPKPEKKAVKYLDRSVQDAFLRAIESSPYKNIYVLGLHTGARISELLGLRWSRVNMDDCSITIDAQLARKQSDGTARALAPTKTSNTRTVVVPDFVVAALRDVRIAQARMRMQAGPLWQNDLDLVFTREDGSPMPHPTIESDFKRIAKLIGHPDLSLHALRHTYATDEIASGTDPKTVADTLGHTTTAMTMDIYAAATTEAKRAAAQRRQTEYTRRKNGI